MASMLVFVTMAIQIVFVVLMIRRISKMVHDDKWDTANFIFDIFAMGIVLLTLFLGHMVQISVWAALFLNLGQFDVFSSAFYHSTVNFTSLGYGDIVMSDKWRLLGALEAANGVLMFGLSTGTILSVMNRLFSHHVSQETSSKGKAN